MSSEYVRYDHGDYNGTISGTGTLVPATTSRNGILAIDCRHENQIIVQLSGTWVATVAFQGSNDNGVTWSSVASSSADGSAGGATTATGNGIYIIPVAFKAFRVQVTAYTSGTLVAKAYISSANYEPTNISIASGQTVTLAPSASSGAGLFSHIMSAATTNATSVKTAAAAVNAIVVSNNGATVAYLKLYNKASAPTVGTDTPVATILVPISGTVSIQASGPAMRFTTGLAYAITGGAPVADTTAVAANQVTGMINYT